jgi:hypothetical protein
MERNAAKAGFLYFLAVFAIGFAFGTVRVLFVEPRLGPVWSVAIEVPIMLVIAWSVARWLVRANSVASTSGRVAMGVLGVILLVIAETLLGIAFGQGLAAQVAAYGTPRGVLTLVGQAGFAVMPLLAGHALRSSLA